MIGKIVSVNVDRAMGTYHPEYPDMYYPINYGYIMGTMAPEGKMFSKEEIENQTCSQEQYFDSQVLM